MNKVMKLNIGSLKDIFIKTLSEIATNKNKILFMLVFIIGLFFGKTLYLNNYEYLNTLFSKCFVFMSDSRLAIGLCILFLLNTGLLIISFFNGFNALGLPIITVIPSVFGVVLGAVTSCLYAEFYLNGVFFAVLSIIPFSLISALFIIASCNSSVRLSSKTAKSVLFGEATSGGEVKSFLISHLIMLAVILISSLLQFLLISKLSEKLLII